jgi:hypothetical protein
MDPESREEIGQTMANVARETGTILHRYPRPGHVIRSVILRDTADDRGTQFEAAEIEDDGTLRVVGHDTGPSVTEFFGAGITSYEWVYMVPRERIDALLRLLSADQRGDALDCLAAYHQQHDGQVSELLRSSEVDAQFANWHS